MTTTYDVNLTGSGFYVTGTITTDGAVGVLSPADIVDWNLASNLPFGPDPFVLTGPLSGANSTLEFTPSSNDLTATATSLFWNFQDTNVATAGIFGFQLNAVYQRVLFGTPISSSYLVEGTGTPGFDPGTDQIGWWITGSIR
jgi:PKD repeat protein